MHYFSSIKLIIRIKKKKKLIIYLKEILYHCIYNMKKGQEKEHTKIKILQFLFAVPSIMVNIIRNGIYMVRNIDMFLFSLGFEKIYTF